MWITSLSFVVTGQTVVCTAAPPALQSASDMKYRLPMRMETMENEENSATARMQPKSSLRDKPGQDQQ